jgi:hypothetical protein
MVLMVLPVVALPVVPAVTVVTVATVGPHRRGERECCSSERSFQNPHVPSPL